MNGEQFKARLASFGLSQSDFARIIQRGSTFDAALRRVQRWASGAAKVSGETIALLNLMTLAEAALQE